MKAIRLLGLLLSVALVVCVASRSASADTWDKKTVMTFTTPVQVPGAVLQPGTYVFKLADSPSDRNIVMIYDRTEQHLITTVLAIPDYTNNPPDQTQVTLEERPGDQPEAIKEWFYPGEYSGQEFIYGGSGMAEQASYTQPAATTESSNTESGNAETQSTVAVTPESDSDNTVAQNDQSAQPAPSATPSDQNSMTQTPATNSNSATSDTGDTNGTSTALPKTASPAPLIGLVGLFFLAGGLVLRSKARACVS